MLRPKMNLRVGYVNVRGLSAASWNACCSLLSQEFDYLFVAETWFVNHRVYSQDRRFIASTTPAARNPQGRPRGGIYLLGTHDARSRVETVTITEHSITFSCNKQSFSGVYFPPTTLSVKELQRYLDSLASSTVILGDINTRFQDPLYQAGEPGPPERLRIFNDFLATTDHRHVKPSVVSKGVQTKLTTDHCFIESCLCPIATLQLLNNKTLKMNTDHQYTLSLILGVASRLGASKTDAIKRFRIGQLKKPGMIESITTLISQQADVFKNKDVDSMNKQLVDICQRVQMQTIGESRRGSRGLTQRSCQNLAQEQTLAASIRLYKQASSVSKENDVILPTARAQAQGISAITENLDVYKKRWLGQSFHTAEDIGTLGNCEPWTREEVVAEIQRQESEKSCSADGIHIQFLKALKDSDLTMWLQELYNQCLLQGETPVAWNYSEVYLLSKDVNGRRDADNLRPISIICIFRKVFERLVLLRFETGPWAKLHPAQAGFRRTYSPYSNAAVLHSLLASKARSTAVFLDFKLAFDMLDHQLLYQKLAARGCPLRLLRLIRCLMFVGLKSRLLVNGQLTNWFPRSRGVFQGSPLSPWLFNLFMDDLLIKINTGILGIPICLFYADDGAIVTHSRTDLQAKLEQVEDWTNQNKIFLNVSKCAVITTRSDLPPLLVYNQEIPQAEAYTYLGFPVSASGINFAQHLEQRLQAAVGRALWLGTQSNAWGPAHRLRIYKQYLAPMFEYGAPLVWAWATENPRNQEAFCKSCSSFKHLMAWISNTSESKHLLTANLCGLTTLKSRFQHLKTAY